MTQADRDQILMSVPNGGEVYLKKDYYIKGAFCEQGMQLKVEGRSAGGLYVFYQFTFSDMGLQESHAHLSFDVLTCRAIQVAEQMVK